MILWPCVGICTFEEVDTSSSLYRLSSVGRALHQSTLLVILGGSSGDVRGSFATRVLRQPVAGVGTKPGSTVVILALDQLGVWFESAHLKPRFTDTVTYRSHVGPRELASAGVCQKPGFIGAWYHGNHLRPWEPAGAGVDQGPGFSGAL